MARRATGKIIEHQGTDGRVYRALRFTAYKKRRYVSLGAVTAVEAERELRHVLADVERGTWQPPQVVEPPPEPEPTPTFHVYAEEWWTLRPALAGELARVRDRQQQASPDGFVFPTGRGGRTSRDNFRSRVLKASVERANENLAKRKLAPLPEGLTPHSLRRTFASVLYALDEDPGIVMDEMGHTDPGLALRIYRQSMRRGEDEKDRLHALVEGVPKRQKLADGRSRPALRERRTPSRRH